MSDHSLHFTDFYHRVFLPEHRQPANIALHVFGTGAGLLLLPAAWLSGMPWLALLFPAVHAVPGLIGHRMFERNGAVGDARINRTDYPLWWFIAANHRMTWELAFKGFHWRAA